MAHSFDRDLRQRLERVGCTLLRQGAKHEVWLSPLTRRAVTVPRGIVSRHTANGILRQAGLPKHC